MLLLDEPKQADLQKRPMPQKSFINLDNVQEVTAHIEIINDSLRKILNQSFDGESKPHAFVTVCSPSYVFGLIGLARSLRSVSEVPLICLIDSEFDTSKLDLAGVYYLQVPRLINASYQPGRQEFSVVLTKLWTFGLYYFRKIVFLDCDVAVFRNVDSLFDACAPSFAPDYVDHTHTQRFNSGVFVVEPNKDEFRRLINFAAKGHSYDGGDQGLLNNYYRGAHGWLPRVYNVTRHAAHYQADILFDKKDIAILHYIVKKPWEIKYREACDAFLATLEDLWTKNLTKEDLLSLIKHWRREIFILYEREKFSLSRSRDKEIRILKKVQAVLIITSIFQMLFIAWLLIKVN